MWDGRPQKEIVLITTDQGAASKLKKGVETKISSKS